MIISEYLNETGKKFRPRRFLIKCDECGIEYNRDIFSQRKRFKLYGKDLCRSCGQTEQYKNGNRSKNQCYKGGQSAKLKMKGKTNKELYPTEKYEEILEKIAKHSRGSKNNMFGKNYQTHGLIKFAKSLLGKTNKEIYGDEKSLNIKDKLSKASSGENNPMYGKPSPKGSGNGWAGWYKGWYFRSLRELSFMINVIERFKFNWRSAEKANLKIKYLDYKRNSKTYMADFLINGKYLVEIKPKKLHGSDLTQRKAKAAMEFCNNNGLKYKLLDSSILSKEKIIELIKTNQIKFIKRYEQRVKDYLHL
jgi:hypothetical protein